MAIRDEIFAQKSVVVKSQHIIISDAARPKLLMQIHYNHAGGEASYRQACDTLYWLNIQREIQDFVQQCCVSNEYAHEQQKELMMSQGLCTLSPFLSSEIDARLKKILPHAVPIMFTH